MCPKCGGDLYLNLDKDLSCRMCGKVIVLTIRREYDSKRGKIRDNKKEARGGKLDSDSIVDGRNLWNKGTQKYHTKMVRQRGLSGKRGR